MNLERARQQNLCNISSIASTDKSYDLQNQGLISIIIPVYKAERYLDDCIKSVTSQTYSNLEIILVDDGSPDKCPQMCDSWALRDSRIRVVHKQNSGQAMARNTGLQMARGEYIGFMDDDDWISPNMYEILLTDLISYDVDYAQTTVMLSYKDQERLATTSLNSHVWRGTSKDAFFLLFTEVTGPVIWDKLYKKELFSGLTFPNETLGDDIPVTCEIFQRSKSFVLDARSPLYHYRQIASSQSRTETVSTYYAQASRDVFIYVNKNYPEISPYATVYYMKNLVWAYEQIIRGGNDKKWVNFKRFAESEIRDSLEIIQRGIDYTIMPITRFTRLRWLILAHFPSLFLVTYNIFYFTKSHFFIRDYT